MREVDEGKAKLTPLQGGLPFDVEYSIVFTTSVREVRRGFPPVTNHVADVRFIRTTNESHIQPGEYLLERSSEINRVKLLEGGWHLLSWPPG